MLVVVVDQLLRGSHCCHHHVHIHMFVQVAGSSSLEQSSLRKQASLQTKRQSAAMARLLRFDKSLEQPALR